ncbi:MAG: RNA polymerase sigma factor [Candidatus Eremiobacteraeota bacterium]|nr:RNA polymerase sigma factor [Candidatus Eremiobacteraeota bacterium]
MTTEIDRRLEAIWRIESPRLIAGLTRVVRDVGVAEELAQDAFVAALTQWPESGIPDNPGAWLTTTAKRRAIDRFRRDEVLVRKTDQLARETPLSTSIEAELENLDQDVGDDMLRLIFIACHPILSREARIALTLRLLGGLTTIEIARAFLTPEPTIAQRIVRAKRTLSEAHVPFELPPANERAARLSSVLEVIYLIFNEGYSATSGDDVVRPELCQDALRLGRVLAHYMREEGEVLGLVSLMELQFSRSAARAGADGRPVLLADQDRLRWDRVLISRGLHALERAQALGAYGPYTVQAGIAACHARAATFDDTDWKRIAALYDALAEQLPTPVVRLNRAVAIGMAFGAEAAVPLVDELSDEPALRSYYLLPAVRGDLFERMSRFSDAIMEFERAATLAVNERDQKFLRARAAACRNR